MLSSSRSQVSGNLIDLPSENLSLFCSRTKLSLQVDLSMEKDAENINLTEMQKENWPFSTSTPKKPEVNVIKVLREKQSTNQQQNKKNTNDKKGFTAAPKPPKRNRKSIGNENHVKPIQQAPMQQQKVDDKERELKRRQQAVEAMKISEQRRLRLIQEQIHEDTVNDDLANFSVSVSPIRGMATMSIDSEAEKKRQQIKSMKRQRIQQYLAEQEARKQREMAKMMPPMSSQSHELKSTQGFTHQAPRRSNYRLPVVSEGREMKNHPMITRKIKYSMEEIRSLNPYGYYFM